MKLRPIFVVLLVSLTVFSWGSIVTTSQAPIITAQKYLEPQFQEAALFAANSIVRQIGKTNHNYTQDAIEFDLGSSKLYKGVLFQISVETAPSQSLQIQFVDSLLPLDEVLMEKKGLPSKFLLSADPVLPEELTKDVVSDFISNPTLQPIVLEGPMELVFRESKENVRMRLPNDVQTDPFRSIKINPGVKVNLQGINSLSLVDPLNIQLAASNKGLSIHWNKVPTLQVEGNSLLFSSEQRTKVKKSGPLKIEFANASSSIQTPRSNMGYDIENPSLAKTVLNVLQQTRQYLSASTDSRFRRILGGTAKAVTVFLVPIKIPNPRTGVVSNWVVGVAQDVSGTKSLISYQKQETQGEITFSQGLMNNGTLAEAFNDLLSNVPELRRE